MIDRESWCCSTPSLCLFVPANVLSDDGTTLLLVPPLQGPLKGQFSISTSMSQFKRLGVVIILHLVSLLWVGRYQKYLQKPDGNVKKIRHPIPNFCAPIPNFCATLFQTSAHPIPNFCAPYSKLLRPYSKLLRQFPIGWPSYSVDQAPYSKLLRHPIPNFCAPYSKLLRPLFQTSAPVSHWLTQLQCGPGQWRSSAGDTARAANWPAITGVTRQAGGQKTQQETVMSRVGRVRSSLVSQTSIK